MNLTIFLTDEEIGLLNDAAVSFGMSIEDYAYKVLCEKVFYREVDL